MQRLGGQISAFIRAEEAFNRGEQQLFQKLYERKADEVWDYPGTIGGSFKVIAALDKLRKFCLNPGNIVLDETDPYDQIIYNFTKLYQSHPSQQDAVSRQRMYERSANKLSFKIQEISVGILACIGTRNTKSIRIALSNFPLDNETDINVYYELLAFIRDSDPKTYHKSQFDKSKYPQKLHQAIDRVLTEYSYDDLISDEYSPPEEFIFECRIQAQNVAKAELDRVQDTNQLIHKQKIDKRVEFFKIFIERTEKYQKKFQEYANREIKVESDPTEADIRRFHTFKKESSYPKAKAILEDLKARFVPFSTFTQLDKGVRVLVFKHYETVSNNGQVTRYGLKSLMDETGICFEQLVSLRDKDAEKAKLVIKNAFLIKTLAQHCVFSFDMFSSMSFDKMKLYLDNLQAVIALHREIHIRKGSPKLLMALPYSCLAKILTDPTTYQDFYASITNHRRRTNNLIQLLLKFGGTVYPNIGPQEDRMTYLVAFSRLSEENKEFLLSKKVDQILPLIDQGLTFEEMIDLFRKYTSEDQKIIAAAFENYPQFVKTAKDLGVSLLTICEGFVRMKAATDLFSNHLALEHIMKFTETAIIMTPDQKFKEIIRVNAIKNLNCLFPGHFFCKGHNDYDMFVLLASSKIRLEEYVRSIDFFSSLFTPTRVKQIHELRPSLWPHLNVEILKVFNEKPYIVDDFLKVKEISDELIVKSPQLLSNLLARDWELKRDIENGMHLDEIVEKYGDNIFWLSPQEARILTFDESPFVHAVAVEKMNNSNNRRILQKNENAGKIDCLFREGNISYADLQTLPECKLELVLNNYEKVVRILRCKGKAPMSFNLLMILPVSELHAIFNKRVAFQKVIDSIVSGHCALKKITFIKFMESQVHEGGGTYLSRFESLPFDDREFMLSEKNVSSLKIMIELKFPLSACLMLLKKYSAMMPIWTSSLNQHAGFVSRALELQITPETICKTVYTASICKTVYTASSSYEVQFINHPDKLARLMQLTAPHFDTPDKKLEYILLVDQTLKLSNVLYNFELLNEFVGSNIYLDSIAGFSYSFWDLIQKISKLVPQYFPQIDDFKFGILQKYTEEMVKFLNMGAPRSLLKLSSENLEIVCLKASEIEREVSLLKTSWDDILERYIPKREEPSASKKRKDME